MVGLLKGRAAVLGWRHLTKIGPVGSTGAPGHPRVLPVTWIRSGRGLSVGSSAELRQGQGRMKGLDVHEVV